MRINDADVTLDGLNLINGEAGTSYGGCIANTGGDLEVRNSTISGCRALVGGGIYHYAGDLDMSGSTLSNNRAIFGAGLVNFGIANKPDSAIRNSTISGNIASFSYAGVLNRNADLSLTNSTVSGNRAAYGYSGGIGNYTDLVDTGLQIQSSTISGNFAYYGGAAITNTTYGSETGGSGSALAIGGRRERLVERWSPKRIAQRPSMMAVTEPTAEVNISDSLISDNETYYYAGGVLNLSNTGGVSNITIANSTLSGNRAGYGGAAINAVYGGGSAGLDLLNATLSDNQSGYAPSPGGLMIYSGEVSIHNSIIANSLVGPDCLGTPSSVSNSLIEDAGCSPQLSGDPLLGPLLNNGGPTDTHALLSGSPAIDQGDNQLAYDAGLLSDQRGMARFFNTIVDLGAYEFDGAGSPDGDGVNTGIEDQVPNAFGGGLGDGDGNMAQDSTEGNVASFPALNGIHVTLKANGGEQLDNLYVVAAANGLPDNLVLPFGLIGFQATGVTGSVNMSLYIPVDSGGYGYWKQHTDGNWYNIAGNSVVDPGSTKRRINFTIIDNGPYDSDPRLGVVRDPGGPGSYVRNIPTLGEWSRGLLAAGLGVLGLLGLRRKGRGNQSSSR